MTVRGGAEERAVCAEQCKGTASIAKPVMVTAALML